MGLLTLGVGSIGCFCVSLGGCVALRRIAGRLHFLDVPNERSLHRVPVPRLGGLAIVGVTLSAVGLWSCFKSPHHDVLVWLGASVAVAMLGLVDDVSPLGASVRLPIQIAIATVFCVALGLPGKITLAGGYAYALPPAVIAPLSVFWIVAVLNIYNFMDGMDGLAGSQAITAAVTLAVANVLHGRGDVATVALAVAAASGGFLTQNAPPARIFMGDVGSTFLGFSFASLALLGLKGSDAIPFCVVVFALAPFLLDGTYTLMWRAIRREPVWKAHRSHLYQRAVATGLTHRQVLVPYLGWMAVALCSGCVAARCGAPGTLILVGIQLLAFAIVLRWVRRLEQS